MKTLYTIHDIADILQKANSVEEIDAYRNDIINLISIVEPMMGFDQNNDAHQYDLWMHSLHTVVNLPRHLDDNVIYLAALLHDAGKPYCINFIEKDDQFHFYGHPKVGYKMVKESDLIERMHSEGYTLSDTQKMLFYIKHHDDHISNKEKYLKYYLLYLNLREFKMLMHLQVADAKAHVIKPIIQQRIEICEKWIGDYGDSVYRNLLYKAV